MPRVVKCRAVVIAVMIVMGVALATRDSPVLAQGPPLHRAVRSAGQVYPTPSAEDIVAGNLEQQAAQAQARAQAAAAAAQSAKAAANQAQAAAADARQKADEARLKAQALRSQAAADLAAQADAAARQADVAAQAARAKADEARQWADRLAGQYQALAGELQQARDENQQLQADNHLLQNNTANLQQQLDASNRRYAEQAQTQRTLNVLFAFGVIVMTALAWVTIRRLQAATQAQAKPAAQPATGTTIDQQPAPGKAVPLLAIQSAVLGEQLEQLFENR